jgi:hypothetical protein
MIEEYGERIARTPFIQGGIIFGIALLIASLEKLASIIGLFDSDQNSPWIIFTSFILFFSIATSLMSLKAANMNKYWGKSMMTFMAVLVLSGLFATLYSGLSIDEAGSFRWLFFVLTFGYLVFLSIVRLMKRIVDMAIKQDERLRGE